MNTAPVQSPETLDMVAREHTVRIASVDWGAMASAEGKRLQALGIDEGAQISVVHRGVFGTSDPLAIMVGRMTIAVRRVHARAITVEPV